MQEIKSALAELTQMQNDTHIEASRAIINKCKDVLTKVLEQQPKFFVHDLAVDEYVLCDSINDVPHMRNIVIIESGDITAQSVLEYMIGVISNEKAKKEEESS